MMKKFTSTGIKVCLGALTVAALTMVGSKTNYLESSSHREAPLIANDPLADNTDVYAFRNPANPRNMVIIANYIPFQLPYGGPNYYSFGENIAYDIHVKNDATTAGDDILYRFEFKLTNEDPSTFFKIRLGKENLKNTYTCKKSTDGGKSFTTIISNGVVPSYNVGPRSIESAVGLNANYDDLMKKGITTASTGEKVFAGPVDDPFFVDFAIFDLGDVRANKAVNGLRRMNVHSIVLDIPIEKLQKDGKSVRAAKNILDPDYVIGVWASASRPKMKVFEDNGTVKHSGPYVQVSRLGMPLTNEVVIPIGEKDRWNFIPSTKDSKDFEQYFTNPELALYMDDSQFGGAVPGLASLRIQSKSLGAFDFRNGKDGLYSLLNNPAVKGTALDPALFGKYLLRDKQPRSVDLLPIFMTGVPNLPPYQLATGKAGGNPLAVGKPFINNFLPTFGDMLRVNMAVPVTDRTSPDFSNLGLVQAAALGLTDPRFNMNFALQAIPNMDGFPNGRRLEDDVTRIELQAVSGVVLAAVGLGYDDYDPAAGAGTVSAVQKQGAGNLVIMPPAGSVLTGIQSATFGSGTGTGDDFRFDANCQVDVTEVVRKTYGYKITNVTPNFEIAIGTFALVGKNDPCPGVAKTLKVVATYRMGASLATQNLVNVLSFTTGVERNDKDFQAQFPFVAKPWNGVEIGGLTESEKINDTGSNGAAGMQAVKSAGALGVAAPAVMLKQIENYPNPARDVTTFRYRTAVASAVSLRIYDAAGELVATPVNNQQRAAGTYEVPVNVSKLKPGIYYARVQNGTTTQSLKFIVSK